MPRAPPVPVRALQRAEEDALARAARLEAENITLRAVLAAREQTPDLSEFDENETPTSESAGAQVAEPESGMRATQSSVSSSALRSPLPLHVRLAAAERAATERASALALSRGATVSAPLIPRVATLATSAAAASSRSGSNSGLGVVGFGGGARTGREPAKAYSWDKLSNGGKARALRDGPRAASPRRQLQAAAVPSVPHMLPVADLAAAPAPSSSAGEQLLNDINGAMRELGRLLERRRRRAGTAESSASTSSASPPQPSGSPLSLMQTTVSPGTTASSRAHSRSPPPRRAIASSGPRMRRSAATSPQQSPPPSLSPENVPQSLAPPPTPSPASALAAADAALEAADIALQRAAHTGVAAVDAAAFDDASAALAKADEALVFDAPSPLPLWRGVAAAEAAAAAAAAWRQSAASPAPVRRPPPPPRSLQQQSALVTLVPEGNPYASATSVAPTDAVPPTSAAAASSSSLWARMAQSELLSAAMKEASLLSQGSQRLQTRQDLAAGGAAMGSQLLAGLPGHDSSAGAAADSLEDSLVAETNGSPPTYTSATAPSTTTPSAFGVRALLSGISRRSAQAAAEPAAADSAAAPTAAGGRVGLGMPSFPPSGLLPFAASGDARTSAAGAGLAMPRQHASTRPSLFYESAAPAPTYGAAPAAAAAAIAFAAPPRMRLSEARYVLQTPLYAPAPVSAPLPALAAAAAAPTPQQTMLPIDALLNDDVWTEESMRRASAASAAAAALLPVRATRFDLAPLSDADARRRALNAVFPSADV